VPTFTGTGIGTGAVLSMGGNVGTLKVSSVGTGARIVVGGDLKTVNVLTGDMDGAILSDGTVGIGTISIPKGGMNPGGTIGAAHGGIKTITVGGGNVIGLVQAGGTAGIGTISIPKGGFNGTIGAAAGGIKAITIGGSNGNLVGLVTSGGMAGIGTISVSKGGLSGTVSAGHANSGIKTLTLGGGITAGSVVSAGTGGVGTMTVKGNADLALNTTGKLGTLTVSSTPLTPNPTLSGLFNVKLLTTLNGSSANLDRFNITASDGIGKLNVKNITDSTFTGGTIGSIKASGNFTGASTIQALLIGTIDVKGDLGSTSSNIQIALSNTTAKVGTAPPKDALGSLTVGRWARNVELRSAGNLGTVKAGAMDSVTVFAGVAGTVGDRVLPGTLGDFISNPGHARIKSFTVAGIPGVSLGSKGGTEYRMNDVYIAAYEAGTITCGYSNPDNGGVKYGLAAHTLGSWIYTDASGTHTYKPAPGETGDEVINEDLIVRIV